MMRFIRNDYTFINRLEKIRQKYIEQNKKYSLSTQLGAQGFRMSIHVYEWIEEIKEDFCLSVSQKLNDGCEMDIKFKDTSKLIMAICSSILKDENKTLIVSPDEDKSNEARLETEKLLQQGCLVGLDAYMSNNRIEFKNGSIIEFAVPEKESDTIRGKRMCLYDYEYCKKY